MPNRSETLVITPALLRDWALPVPTGGKEHRGTVLVVGGSRFTPGAVLLAGVAALRAGAGVLQLAAAESTATALSIQVPEALVVGLPETRDGAVRGRPGHLLADLVAEADVVAVGPGLQGHRRHPGAAGPGAGRGRPGDGAGARRVRPRRAQPRPGPAGRLGPCRWCSPPTSPRPATCSTADLGDDLDAEAAEVAAPLRRGGLPVRACRRLRTGGAGGRRAATPGSAPPAAATCRAGLLAGLISRGAEPAQAACWAAFAHAVSGQRLVPRYGRIGFLARELLDEIPHTLATV